ncbi:MAG: hypothetical protein ACRDTX_12855 [Pseudonocardiaceae bacterium]
MAEATQFDPDRLRVVLDHGEVVELDGGTLVIDGEESPSVVLRLAPWRARSMARVLEEWSAVSGVLNRVGRPSSDELGLSRTLELAASVLGDGDGALLRFPRGDYTVPSGQRLAAVAVLAEREAGLSAVQRLALVDAASWWLTDPAGGQELAYALIDGVCAQSVTAEHVYLALITPPDQPADQSSD